MRLDNVFVSFGECIKNYRLKNKLTLSIASKAIGIDTSLLSKLERNERTATMQQISCISKFYKINERQLCLIALSDEFVNQVINLDADIEVFKIAEKKIKYFNEKNKTI